jgi:predicted phage terminase large subunit-like protein
MILVDDPQDIMEALNENYDWEADSDYFDQALSTRLNTPGIDPIVLVQQRVGDQDLTSHVLEAQKGQWAHLVLPCEWTGKHRSVTPLPWQDWRTEPGERLHPRYTDEVIAERKIALQALGYSCQFQQDPLPAGGVVFERDWFLQNTWVPGPDGLPLGVELAYMIGSWDLNNAKDGGVTRDTDPVCGDVWGVEIRDTETVVETHLYLLEQRHGVWDLTQSYAEIEAQIAAWPDLSIVLIEKKSNGPTAVKYLQAIYGALIEGYSVQSESKIQRAKAVAPSAQLGRVHIPAPGVCPWVAKEWIPEVCGFPGKRHDDRVDTFSQAAGHVLESGHADVWAA